MSLWDKDEKIIYYFQWFYSRHSSFYSQIPLPAEALPRGKVITETRQFSNNQITFSEIQDIPIKEVALYVLKNVGS